MIAWNVVIFLPLSSSLQSGHICPIITATITTDLSLPSFRMERHGREGIARLESNPFGGPPAKGLVDRWIAVAQRLVRGEKEEEDDTGAAFIAA